MADHAGGGIRGADGLLLDSSRVDDSLARSQTPKPESVRKRATGGWVRTSVAAGVDVLVVQRLPRVGVCLE